MGDKRIEHELAACLKELGVALEVRLTEIGEGLYSLMLRDPVSSAEVNVADAGFGASQIIPIILEVCLLEQDETAIFEQPEIHIHPKGQNTR
jgi:hypothetical protein